MPVLIAGLILSFLIMLLFGGTELDRTLLILAGSTDAPRLDRIAGGIDWLTSDLPLLAAAATGVAYAVVRRRRREAILLAIVVLLGRLLVEAAQLLTSDLRPELGLVAGDSGYPSSHAAGATIVGFTLAFLLTRRAPARPAALALATIFALAAGAARLILGKNWPSDVIGGWALGLAWTLLILMLARFDLGDGTARRVRHSLRQGEKQMADKQDNRRAETARRTDDSELIERMEDAPSFDGASGGELQRDIGSRAEMQRGPVGEPGVTRVQDKDKKEGANLPRFNQK